MAARSTSSCTLSLISGKTAGHNVVTTSVRFAFVPNGSPEVAPHAMMAGLNRLRHQLINVLLCALGKGKEALVYFSFFLR